MTFERAGSVAEIAGDEFVAFIAIVKARDEGGVVEKITDFDEVRAVVNEGLIAGHATRGIACDDAPDTKAERAVLVDDLDAIVANYAGELAEGIVFERRRNGDRRSVRRQAHEEARSGDVADNVTGTIELVGLRNETED